MPIGQSNNYNDVSHRNNGIFRSNKAAMARRSVTCVHVLIISLQLSLWRCHGRSDNIIEVLVDRLPQNQFSRRAHVKTYFKSLTNETTSIKFAGVTEDDDESNYILKRFLHRTNNDIGDSNDVIWHGIRKEQNRTGFCTLALSRNGMLAGTITTDYASYEIVQWPNGTREVRWTKWDEFPPDDDEAELELVAIEEESSSHSSSLEASVGKEVPEFLEGVISKADDIVSYIEESDSWKGYDYYEDQDYNQRNLRKKWRDRFFKKGTVVDVLVVVSNRAMCEYAGQAKGCSSKTYKEMIEAKVGILEAETNQAMEESFVIIKVVAVVIMSFLSYDYDSSFASLTNAKEDDQITNWREEYGADLVAVIGGTGAACGLSVQKGAYSLTSYLCLGQYSFTHEIGHNFGCQHNREACANDHPYAHGFQFGGDYRTMMSYPCSGSACPRLLFFSSSNTKLEGITLGDATHDNSRMIREQASSISNLNRKKIALSCPASDECLGRNQMRRRRFFVFCEMTCVPEKLVATFEPEGWKCGRCLFHRNHAG